jgi:hypothetical protein
MSRPNRILVALSDKERKFLEVEAIRRDQSMAAVLRAGAFTRLRDQNVRRSLFSGL